MGNSESYAPYTQKIASFQLKQLEDKRKKVEDWLKEHGAPQEILDTFNSIVTRSVMVG